jgi:AcrR family transcriptional regulator
MTLKKPKTKQSPSRGGRPRSEEARRAILDAARTLVEEGSYQSATIEAIAARAGVAKTTIYRWWTCRAGLMVDVMVEAANASVPLPERGEPLRALKKELRESGSAVNGLIGRILTSLLGEAQEDPEVRDALLNGLFYPRRVGSAGAIQRAQAGGEIRTDVPPHVAVDLFFGPLFYRMFVQHEPVTDTFIRQVFQYVIEGLKPQGKRK